LSDPAFTAYSKANPPEATTERWSPGRSSRAKSPPQQRLVLTGPHTEAESLLKVVDLRSQRRRVSDVALEHLDCYRAAVARRHQAEQDLQLVALAVATHMRGFESMAFRSRRHGWI